MALTAALVTFATVFAAVAYVGLRLVAGWERIRGGRR